MMQSCPICASQNPDGSEYCARCGNSIPQTGAYAAQQQVQVQAQPSSFQGQQQPIQMGEIQSIATFRRAFAGYGVTVMHHSWLLDGEHVHAGALYSAILELLKQRNFAGFKVSAKKMKETGHQTEERDYILAQRGVSTVFLYVAPAGKDLYISRATSVLSSIDILRVIVLCLLLGFALFGPAILTGMVINTAASSSAGGTATGALTGAVVAVLASLIAFCIWIYLLVMAYRSLRYWLAEKDFWIYLRARDLKDFQMDDIALLEHATDETVRSAVKQLQLDASKIVPPTDGYKTERRIRVV